MDKSMLMLIVGIFLGLGLLLVVLKNMGIGGKNSKFKYKLRQFMSANEEAYFKHFLAIFPDKYIAPQVSMDAVIEPDVALDVKNAEGKNAYQSMRGTIKANKIDFLILDSNYKPQFIIEIDDNTHNNKQEADAQRDKNLKEASIKTIRIRRNKEGFPNRAFFDKALKDMN